MGRKNASQAGKTKPLLRIVASRAAKLKNEDEAREKQRGNKR
jgi:hypothetical protein